MPWGDENVLIFTGSTVKMPFQVVRNEEVAVASCHGVL
jgi:hypothetical protein